MAGKAALQGRTRAACISCVAYRMRGIPVMAGFHPSGSIHISEGKHEKDQIKDAAENVKDKVNEAVVKPAGDSAQEVAGSRRIHIVASRIRQAAVRSNRAPLAWRFVFEHAEGGRWPRGSVNR